MKPLVFVVSLFCFAGVGTRSLAEKRVSSEPRPTVKVETPYGTMTLEVLSDLVPNAANFFLESVRAGRYNKASVTDIRRAYRFTLTPAKQHKIDFMLPDEFHQHASHTQPGVVGLTSSGPNTSGLELYFTLAKTLHLDQRSIAVARVVEGLDVLDKIAQVERQGFKPKTNLVFSRFELTDPELAIRKVQSLPKLGKKGIEQLTAALARQLATATGKLTTVGKVTKLKLLQTTRLGTSVQATYRVDFDRRRDSRLILQGSYNEKLAFELRHYQFSQGSHMKPLTKK